MPLPTCLSCSAPLATRYDAIMKEATKRREEYCEKSSVIPTMLYFDNQFNAQLGDLLDKYNVTKACCRKSIMTYTRTPNEEQIYGKDYGQSVGNSGFA